jgi:hypothetical protein
LPLRLQIRIQKTQWRTPRNTYQQSQHTHLLTLHNRLRPRPILIQRNIRTIRQPRQQIRHRPYISKRPTSHKRRNSPSPTISLGFPLQLKTVQKIVIDRIIKKEGRCPSFFIILSKYLLPLSLLLHCQ